MHLALEFVTWLLRKNRFFYPPSWTDWNCLLIIFIFAYFDHFFIPWWKSNFQLIPVWIISEQTNQVSTPFNTVPMNAQWRLLCKVWRWNKTDYTHTYPHTLSLIKKILVLQVYSFSGGVIFVQKQGILLYGWSLPAFN